MLEVTLLIGSPLGAALARQEFTNWHEAVACADKIIKIAERKDQDVLSLYIVYKGKQLTIPKGLEGRIKEGMKDE